MLGLLLIALSGCAAQVWLSRPMVLDEYPAAQVRVYRADRTCRIEVVTPTETILTLPTRCLVVARRSAP